MRLTGKKYMLLFCWLLTAPKAKITDVDINHEAIHTAQMKELLYIFFYLWYITEWFIRLLKYKNAHKAYRNISFERESYVNEGNFEYLESRATFNFLNYL